MENRCVGTGYGFMECEERFLGPLLMHVPLTGVVELKYPDGFSEMTA